ncbi:complex I NDUFA9 subunit family protein [Hyphomicrobium methylovorum]|uniref:complex I NDUFA9 subunit family protein n=1 Tax=Hyphomicrobium methylovorum TaxID=84 RepID=UPI0015E78C4B|nr:complex I NDUFA9 subunit family protein [Hyphomicrobium methylovorum]MBA2125596.1 complex I NDUFA9 subunit family protein [Hyphomicrobium methylovorum]
MADSGKLATVFGGSGFVGRYIVRSLAQRGWRVRAAVRRPDLAGFLQPMGVVGQVHAVQANLRFADSVARALEGADIAINAVGILAPTGAQTFNAVHTEGARHVAKAARELGVKHLVHISAIGADQGAKAEYARTKAAAEAAVFQEFPSAVALRPSIVFGPEDQFFNRFAALARLSPALPLIGGGRTKFEPVFVGDVGAAAVNAATGLGTPGTVYELGGPEVLTFKQLLEATLRYADRSRLLIPVPFWMAQLQALATWPLPNAIRPITVDQVRLLKSDNVVSEAARREGRTLTSLGVAHPAAIELIVPQYLERFKPKGQYAHYRA